MKRKARATAERSARKRRERERAGKPAASVRTSSRSRLGGWRQQHRWGLVACLQRLSARPLSTAMTVAVMGFALALPLALYLLLGNLQQLGATLGESQAISVFLKPDAKVQDAKALVARLRGRRDVAAVTMRTPQQGIAELAAMQGFGKAIDALGYNPLPYVLLVKPMPVSRAAIDTLVEGLRAQAGVDLVQDDGAWRQRLDALLGLGRRAMLLLALLLGLAALLVVGNTVRMDIQSRGEEIAVLRLIGASGAFVRRPYLYAGLCYGLASGIVAVLLVLALEWALAAPAEDLLVSYGQRLHIGSLGVGVLLLVPLIGAALGWLGARLVSARHLGATMPGNERGARG